MDFSSIPILASAIAIIISWALFAIFCGLIQEAFAQIKAERGRFMKNYMLLQLYDAPNDINWGDRLYLHGNIDLLSRAPDKPTSEISPRLFAETLVDITANAEMIKKDFSLVQSTITYQHPTLRYFKAATLLLKPSDMRTFFTQALNNAELSNKTPEGTIDEAKVYTSLVHHFEAWYIDFNSRMSLWYKKKIRVWLFFIGLVLGAILNVDSIQLFQHFSDQPATAKVMRNYYEKDTAALSALTNQLASTDVDRNIDSIRSDIKAYTSKMEMLIAEAKLPVGWQYSMFQKWPAENLISFWILKILGVLITGFAASFGAPFWFDLLKKIYSKKV